MQKKQFFLFIISVVLSGCMTTPVAKNSDPVINLEKIEISKDALAWVRSAEPVARKLRLSATYPQDGYYECRETKEVANTILCHFNNKEEMGYALARASCFIEGSFCSHPRGTVIGFNDPGFRTALLSINGFDLKGSDLITFYKAAVQKCAETKSDEFCLNHFEKKFFENMIRPWSEAQPNFVLITFARFSGEHWHKSLVHEIMHAQYFQDLRYREIVENYWKTQLKEKDRIAIRSALSVAYDPKDEFLMINEFQAYLLQAGGEEPSSLLHKFVSAHRDRLIKRLEDKGIHPVQVKITVPK